MRSKSPERPEPSHVLLLPVELRLNRILFKLGMLRRESKSTLMTPRLLVMTIMVAMTLLTQLIVKCMSPDANANTCSLTLSKMWMLAVGETPCIPNGRQKGNWGPVTMWRGYMGPVTICLLAEASAIPTPPTPAILGATISCMYML